LDAPACTSLDVHVADNVTVHLDDAGLELRVRKPAAYFVRADGRLTVEPVGHGICDRGDRFCVRLLCRAQGLAFSYWNLAQVSLLGA
jgi:hypothetical protein